jgi:hypothetical protein
MKNSGAGLGINNIMALTDPPEVKCLGSSHYKPKPSLSGHVTRHHKLCSTLAQSRLRVIYERPMLPPRYSENFPIFSSVCPVQQ